MSIESLTYAELGDRLGASPEAARSVARRLRLPRRPGNDGKVRITVDLAEIRHKPLPARPPGGHRAEIDRLNARVEQLEGELARLEVEKQCVEVRAAGHRVDFECERERCDTLVTEALKLGTIAMSAREKAARLDGELSAARARRRWWRRLIAPDAVQTRPRAEETGKAQYSRACPFGFDQWRMGRVIGGFGGSISGFPWGYQTPRLGNQGWRNS